MFTDPHPDLIRPVRSDQFLPPISPWARLGSALLIGTVGMAIVLAAFVRYGVTIKAAATVRPTGETRVVQTALEGTIAKIEVKENQVVKTGDVIATLDDAQLQTHQRQLQGNIQQAEQQLAQLAAQIAALSTQQAAEADLMERTVASAQANLDQNQRTYQDQQITTQTQVQEATAELKFAQTELEQYRQLADTGAVAQLEIQQKEAVFQAAQAKLERAEAGQNPSLAPVAIATERIGQEQARGSSTLAALNKEQESLQQRQTELQNQMNRDRQTLQQAELDLNKTVIRATDAGTIFKLDLHNVNQVMQRGDAIAQIAPSETALVIKARVPAREISQVGLCQEPIVNNCSTGKVQLRFSAYPYPDYGTLLGAVRAIAPDTTITTDNAAPYYEVTIQPEQLYLTRDDRQYFIQSGMEVTADLVSREETILTFILRKARLLTDL
jgi:HlyD family type I secretion membrane fusion protein